jgi:hypothetical protein
MRIGVPGTPIEMLGHKEIHKARQVRRSPLVPSLLVHRNTDRMAVDLEDEGNPLSSSVRHVNRVTGVHVDQGLSEELPHLIDNHQISSHYVVEDLGSIFEVFLESVSEITRSRRGSQ